MAKKKVITVVGTPTAILLPARRYKFKVPNQFHTINMPRKGAYTDFDSKLFNKKDGNFDILQYDKSEDTYTVSIADISKVLFASSTYPELEDSQAFAPISIKITEDSVEIIGQVIEMIKEGEE